MEIIETNGNALQHSSAAELGVATREQSEIQAAIIVAKKFPRNEQAAFVKAIKSFTRPSMAESAEYSFPRGGSTVRGPSVDCAREVARCWGNIRYGVRIVERTNTEIHIRGFAYDAETNNYVEAEAKFESKVQRKRDGQTIWVPADERDLRELINKHGAIAVRNCVLQVLPPDLIDDVIKTARDTLEKKGRNELAQNRDDVTKRLVVMFDRVGVSVQMLEGRLGHALNMITEHELVELQQIFNSIREGVGKREEFFTLQTPTGEVENESMTAKLTKKVRPSKTEESQS